jgi:ketosteroid isomerase-like protein/quercetin dioxygenase-like cupin family protein
MRSVHFVMRPLPYLALVCLVAPVPLRAQDAVQADARHYSVALENDHVRVVRIRYGPRERSPLHSHPAGVYVFLTDGRARFTDASGRAQDAVLAARNVGWSDGDRHAVENLTDQPFELVLVEPKGIASSEADVAAVRAAVAAHWKAINDGDRAAVNSHHVPSITLVVADHAARFALNSPAAEPMTRRWQGAKANWTVRDLEVDVYGNTAVATFYLDGSITWPDGTVDRRPRRVTEVWVKRDGSWKEAHHHDSVHAP